MQWYQPVCRPPHSMASSAMDVPTPCAPISSDATYSSASCLISTLMEGTFNWETNYRLATILEILLQTM